MEPDSKRYVAHKITTLQNDINIMKTLTNDLKNEIVEIKKIMMEYLAKPKEEKNYWFYK